MSGRGAGIKDQFAIKRTASIRALRLFVALFSAATVLFFVSNIANDYATLHDVCVLQACGPLGPLSFSLETLSRHHLSPESYALGLVLNDVGLGLLYYAAAFVLFFKSRRDVKACLAVLALVTYGSTFSSLLYIASDGSPAMESWTETIASVGRIALFLFLLLFPNGRPVSRWTFAIFVPFCLAQIASLILPGTSFDLLNWPDHARIAYYGSMIIASVYSQIYRYRKQSTIEMRQQTKWVVYGATLSFLGFFVISGFIVMLPEQTPVSYLILNVLLHSFVSIVPLTLSFAVLRHRLWDIDPLVNRTILYGALSLSIVLIYSVAVIYLGNLFQTEGNFFISLVATSIVAVVFGPLKNQLQKLVNRYMKGKHDDPYSILVGLGNQLIQPIAPEEMLRVVTETVRDALRLPFVGLSIGVNGREKEAAASGTGKYDMHSFPIILGGETLGSLILSSRSPDEAFTAEDRMLIEVMIRQAAPIVRNVTMTLGMKLLVLDVQESREKLVLAREEERRQIRRNLHDELAPRLLSLSFNVAAAQQHMAKNPAAAHELLDELRGTIRLTVDDIRTMVHDLRPPALDEFGLIGSLQARIHDMAKTQEQLAATLGNSDILEFRLHAPVELPPLPAAVEVAAYRIVTESLVNVVRHARATECVVRVEVSGSDELLLEVSDNGAGLPTRLSSPGNGGIGLTSIRERAAELSGTCSFQRLEKGGTRIKVVLPFSRKETANEYSASG
jgi:signal transduction histidine kinase